MEFKTQDIKDGYELLHPILKQALIDIDKWSMAYDKKSIVLTCTISTLELDKKLNRESPAHSQYRAADIRCNDWATLKISKCVKYFNDKFGPQIGYIRKISGKRVLLYLHGEGPNLHLHCSIGTDIIEKYKKQYPEWNYPTQKPITKKVTK